MLIAYVHAEPGYCSYMGNYMEVDQVPRKGDLFKNEGFLVDNVVWHPQYSYISALYVSNRLPCVNSNVVAVIIISSVH
jgi:hypothetical protein